MKMLKMSRNDEVRDFAVVESPVLSAAFQDSQVMRFVIQSRDEKEPLAVFFKMRITPNDACCDGTLARLPDQLYALRTVICSIANHDRPQTLP
ncbi:hypothetical protein HBH44_123770 [Parastagonospora nodorum]|nr:hypothetical protein HBH45_206150 [Parastagonospora nodorum]KAH4157656.1 hypothetical protein HBH44_123770 [Parastagonospora nodorum]